MRVISLKSRVICIWAAAVVVLLAFLFGLSFLAGLAGYANLLMATPNTLSAPALNIEKLEDLSEDEFLLTYAVRQPASAQAINSKHSVILVGTNHNYANIMGYIPLDGGFFTKSAMDAKNKYVTLNETTAFQMFGSNRITGKPLKINGETWVVTGVIQDNDTENLNLYVPASVSGRKTDSIMVLMDGIFTEAYVKNALKSIGVHDDSYDFVNLSKSAGAFAERFAVAWKTALLTMIIFIIYLTGSKLLNQLRLLHDRLHDVYFKELIFHYRKELLKVMGALAAVVGGITAALALSLQILAICLSWQELTPIAGELIDGAFGHKLRWLRDCQLPGEVLFWACVGIAFFGFMYILIRRAKEPKPGTGKRKVLIRHGESELAGHI